MGRNRNRKKNKKNTGYTPPVKSAARAGFRGWVAPPKPVRSFDRPKNESFTVSFTGDNEFPDVYVSGPAHGKMLALVKECPIEISWMCSVTRRDNGDFDINDVYVPLQFCGPANTEISEEGDEALMMELITAGKAEELNNLRCWGHSHVNMAVFASGTDESQTQDFLDNLGEAGSDHFVRFIANKRGELLCHVYLLNQGIILNNPKMYIRVDDIDYSDWAKTQIADKVTRFAPAVAPRPYGYGANMGADRSIPSNAVGFWMGDQFIEDDLNFGSSPLYDDVQDDTHLGNVTHLHDPEPLTGYEEFVTYPDPRDRDDDPYDFATRGQ